MYADVTEPEGTDIDWNPPGSFVTRASAALLQRLDGIADRLTAQIEQAESFYGGAGLVASQDLWLSNRANLGAALAYLSRHTAPSTAAPRDTGRRRAEAGVPLPSVLRAYRIGGEVIWDELLAEAGDDSRANQELLAVATEIWRLMDEYSQALTVGYQEAITAQVRRDAGAHDAAMDALFSGQTDGARLWECARTLGLPAHGEFVVAAASTETAATEALPGIDTALSMLGVASAWRLRMDTHIGIISLTARFTAERLCALLAERAVDRIGVSSAFTTLPETPVALHQAELACAAAHPGSGEVLRYEEALIPVLLAGSPAVSGALAEAVLGPILALPAHDRDTLLTTVCEWFERDGDVAAVAAALFCHRNTVRLRLSRVAQLTGRRLATPRAATEIDLALRAHRILGGNTTDR
ncbi:PucR family transcriptional regulator [Nocardia sp. CWNU-33]|uniref:PucR family transcriptional regulator n=1 Tax=Nocardia sp. CWNU-33 TaxID=3392117 RepID=UPI00398E3BCA